jgi:hypothetical protein
MTKSLSPDSVYRVLIEQTIIDYTQYEIMPKRCVIAYSQLSIYLCAVCKCRKQGEVGEERTAGSDPKNRFSGGPISLDPSSTIFGLLLLLLTVTKMLPTCQLTTLEKTKRM